jgi:hypothetical protein
MKTYMSFGEKNSKVREDVVFVASCNQSTSPNQITKCIKHVHHNGAPRCVVHKERSKVSRLEGKYSYYFDMKWIGKSSFQKPNWFDDQHGHVSKKSQNNLFLLRGLDDYMILDEQAFRIKNDKGTLLIWILNSCWFWIMMRRFGTTQRGRFWKRETFLNAQYWEE